MPIRYLGEETMIIRMQPFWLVQSMKDVPVQIARTLHHTELAEPEKSDLCGLQFADVVGGWWGSCRIFVARPRPRVRCSLSQSTSPYVSPFLPICLKALEGFFVELFWD